MACLFIVRLYSSPIVILGFGIGIGISDLAASDPEGAAPAAVPTSAAAAPANCPSQHE